MLGVANLHVLPLLSGLYNRWAEPERSMVARMVEIEFPILSLSAFL